MMNPGSGFGSGFGQQQSSSPFGTSPGFGSSGSTSNTAPGFGASITLTGSASFGSGSQGFGSGTTASPDFGTGSVTLTGANNTGFNPSTFSTAGFGSAPGFGSTSSRTGNGNTGGFSRTSDSIFGTSGSRASVFGSSASSTQGFSTSVSSSAPSFGTGNPNAGFASTSSGSSAPVFGTTTSVPSGFSAQTTTSAKPTGAGTVFGSGFGSPSSSTAGGSVFSAAGSVFGAVSSPATSAVSSASGAGFGGGGMRGFGTTTRSTAPPLGSGSSGFGTASGTGLSGAGTGSAGFGTSSSGFGTGSAGFGTGSSGFSTGSAGFGTGSSGFGTGSSGLGTGSSGFGTGSSGLGTGSSGFGTGSSGLGTGTAGFGTGSSRFGTRSSGFGTGTAGFGTGSSGLGTGSAGFGTGSSGVGTGSAGFGTGSSGAGTGSSGFGTASSGSGFGPGTGGGFGGGSSVFGTSSSAGPASTSFKLPSTQIQSTSVFGGPSVFGTQTTKGSDGSSGPMSTATSTNSSMSSPMGFSALGSKTDSVFGQTSDKNQSGLSRVASSVFSQSSSAAPTAFTSSAASSSSTGVPGVTSGFGSVTAPSSVAVRPTTTSSVSTSSSFFGGGGGQAASVFGSSQMGAATSQSQTGLSTSQSASSPAGGSAPSFALPVSSGAQSSAFGASTTTFLSVFGGAAKHSQPEGSVFGGAGKTVVKQEPSQTSRSSDSQAAPFPVAAAGSGASVFGGGSSKPSSGQRFTPQAGSSNMFGGLRGDSTKPGTTQPSSTTASVFGGRIGPSVFGTRQSQESATSGKQAHGGRQTSETGQQPASSGQPQFPSAAATAAENQPKGKQEPGGKELFGGFPGEKPREGEGAIKSEALGTSREGQGSKLLKSGRVLARGSGLETGSSGGGGGSSSSVFGGKREAALSSAAPAASSVFGGKRQTSETGQQPASSGQPQFPSAAATAAENQPKGKQEPGGKELFGGFPGEKPREGEGAIKSEALGTSREGQGSKLLKSGRVLARGSGLETGSSGGGSSSSVFGGKREAALSSAAPAASSVFRGKREPGSTFSFPAAPPSGGSSRNQKRSAEGEGEGAREVKRGRSWKQMQDRSERESEDRPSTSHTPEKLKLRRSSSVLEDISSKTTISCKGVPASLNKGLILRQHFSRFGKVKQVRPVPAKRAATIQFESHEAAAKAKKFGTKLPKHDKPLSIFWKTSTTERSPSTGEEAARAERFSRKGSAKPDASAPRGQSSELQQYSLPSTVAAELASMSGADSSACDPKLHAPDRSSSSSAGDRAARQGRSSRRTEPSRHTRSKIPPASASASSTTSSGSTKPVKVDAATLSSLRNTIATTTMEKVNVLDLRDKLIRQKLGKQTLGGIDSKAFVGTCPDMCPEKERLYREEVRRLSLYEIIPGSSTLTGSTSLVDHARAVKEYSRSSADQDEPLPHELRPLPVLTMTMNYLLTEIANRWEEERWAEWYDFLWNRTRSIRKEITQQQLCSLEVVELLEKCTRFHVYCSERLCTEDSMVFDSKINDENLTKCLQTLKELYADMENKHGLFCPNEAEFRAYMVLMNLNEGDTLREVQQLRPDVRASPHIGFAVKAYSALNSNNYVRFFRLVKSASFLNACILHRYFNQIRARALQIILRSHTARQKKVGFSLSELVRLLVFENEEDVREFCSYYSLRTEGSDLILDRSTYVEPESSIPMWRACGLVESKCMVSVGEVINGGHLEPPKLPPPQCSFDEQGRFIGHLEGLTDNGGAQERLKPFTVKASAKPPAPQPSALEQFEMAAADTPTPAAAQHDAAASQQQQQANFSNEMVKMIARELFWEVIDESVRIIAQSGVEACRKVMSCDVDISDEIFTSVTADLSREVSVEVVDAEREHQDQVAAAERREREERVAADLQQALVDSAVDEQLSQIVQKEVEDAQAKDEADRLERCTHSLHLELLDEVTAEMALQVADQVHQVDVVARLQLLSDLQRAVELKRLGQWLTVWRQVLLVRQRQKRAMLDFPCAPPMQSASQRLQEMFPDRPHNVLPLVPGKPHLLVNHRAHVTLLSPLEAEQRSLSLTAHLSLASLLNSLQRARAWQPLKLGSLLRAPLLQSLRRWPQRFLAEFAPLGVHWKLLLSLPGDLEMEEQDEDSDDDMTGDLKHRDLLPVLKQWLCAKFTRGEGGNSTVDASQRNLLSLYSVELAAGASGPSSELRLSIIVRNTPEFSRKDGDEQPNPEHVLSVTKGTSAILFLLPHANTASDIQWLAARLRLARLLEAKPMIPPTPLVLLLPFGRSAGAPASPSALTSDVTGRLDIEKFQDQGLLSCVAVVELPVTAGQPPDVAVASPVLQAQVTEAVKFLASKVPEPPDLRRQPLGDLVEDVLTQHFFTPVLQDLKCRQQLGKLHQAPNAVIGLYNSVLDHLALALTSPALQDISWPAPELQHTAAKLDGVPMADWNSKSHLADIYGVVTNLRLPWFHYKDQSAREWGQACHDVWAFVSGVVKKRCNSAVSLTTRISHLLARTCLQFENVCSLTLNEDHCNPAYVNAPWTDIILACVDFRLQRLHNWKEEEDLLGGDLQVFYEEEDLEEFEPPASWLQALLDTEDSEIHRVEDTIKQATLLHFANTTCTGADTFSSRHLHPDGDDKDHEEDKKSDEGGEPSYQSSGGSASNRTLLAAAQDFSQLPDNIRSALDASSKLRLHVGEERQRAQDFERYLEKALRGETAPEVDVSHILPAASHTPRVLHTPALASTSSSSGIWSEPRQEAAAAASAGRDFGLTPQRPPLSSTLLPRKRLQQDAGAVSSPREVEEDSHKGVEADVAARGERQPLSQRLDRLKEDLRAQRYASELFEKRLRNFLES